MLMLWKTGATCAVHGVLRYDGCLSQCRPGAHLRNETDVASAAEGSTHLWLSSWGPLDELAATGAGVSLLCGS
jgi:hypothetical protein